MRAFLKTILIILPVVSFSECKKEVLPTIPYLNIKLVTAGGMICYGTISNDGGSSTIERGFKWETEQEADYQNGKIAFDNGLNYFETIITGLSPSTTYYVKAYATNSAGTAYSAEKEVTTSKVGTFTDSRDGRAYKWIEIGNQIWMAENLSYLPYVSSFTSDTGIFVYNYKGSSVAVARNQEEFRTYGCLYTWEISLQVCPDGWHLPSDEEWQELEKSIGMTSSQIGQYSWHGTYEDNLLKIAGTTYWSEPYGKPNNATLFSALPAGYHHHEYENNGYIYFHGLGYSTYFGSSTILDFPIMIGLDFYYQGIMRTQASENTGCSIRCIRD
jgi:uncharacterized protein (TIGR02145 family)